MISRPFNVELFGEGTDRGASQLVQCRQSQKLRDPKPRGLKMGVIKTGDPPGRLPHSEAVALIDSERLVDRQHPWSLTKFV